MKKVLRIDGDLWDATGLYVDKQLKIMKLTMSAEKRGELILKVAQYPQEVRNLQAKLERRRVQEAWNAAEHI